jgi:hypothetical protein
MQARLIVVDKHTGRNMHGIHEYQSLADAALLQASVDLAGNVHKTPPRGYFKPEFLAV